MRHYKERENWRIYCWLSVRMLRKYRRHLLTRMNEEWEYVPVGSALMFWMRRAIDGTDQQFVDLFTNSIKVTMLKSMSEILISGYFPHLKTFHLERFNFKDR